MKIGLFGGVFNPPHVGHQMIARQILDFTDVERVWFVPNFGQNPPKPGVTDPAHRLAMVKMLVIPGTDACSIEIDRKLDGKTIHLLPYLPPEHEYVFIMGSDWLPEFKNWGNWQELLKKLPFYVFPRYGYPSAPLYPNMTEVENDLLITTDISSTKIRGRIHRGLPVDQFVPPEIIRYIKEHGLYRHDNYC